MHTISTTLATAAFAALANAFTPIVAQAQGAPSVHWGATDLPTTVVNCLGRARKAFYDAGARNVQNTGWQVYAEKGNANVVVSCTPLNDQKSYLVLVAASPDSKAAELLRNDIRTRIARMKEL
jgi:hypothetical protein